MSRPEHVIAWEFRVRDGSEPAFEETYGPQGAWARLFARSAEYVGTDLLRDVNDRRRYVTLDRWLTAEAFERFCALHGAEYAALDARCAEWTIEEKRLGSWTGS